MFSHLTCSLTALFICMFNAGSFSENDPGFFNQDHYFESHSPPVVETIVVEGNYRTSYNLIIRLLDIEKGSPLDEKKLNAGKSRLSDLGLFQHIGFRLERGTAPGLIILVVIVKERGSILLSDLFFGFSETSPFFGGFGLTDTNPGSSALIVNGAFAMDGIGRRSFRFFLSSPSLPDRQLSKSIMLLYLDGKELKKADSPDGTPDASDILRYRRIGAAALAGLSLNRHSSIALHYRFEHISSEIELANQQNPEVPEDILYNRFPFIAAGNSLLSVAGGTYEHNSTDDPFLAGKGITAYLMAETGSHVFFSDYEYSGYSLDFAAFKSFWNRHFFKLGFYGSFIQGNAPFFNRFHAPDHRFFSTGNALPRIMELSFSENSRYDNFLMSIDTSYRIPIRQFSRYVYRSYFYISCAFTISSPTVKTPVQLISDNGTGSEMPFSGDIGISLDTHFGVFNLGFAYPLDLFL